jgi:hypothetical protein
VLGLLGSAVLLATIVAGSSAHQTPRGSCPRPQVTPAYARGVERALLAKRDLWGESLLRSPAGPTYEGVRRRLKPLLLVGKPAGTRGRRLTDSGVYYLAFAQPAGVGGAGSVALHVADGSQIVSERGDGPKLTLYVGSRGRERYGSCLARLATPRLYGGYLPILQTRYVDSAGVSYRQESFAARIPQTRSLVSFVRLTVDAGAGVRIRLKPSATGLTRADGRLVRGGNTHLFFSPGGAFDGSSLTYSGTRTIYLARLDRPLPSRPLTLDEPGYEQARRAVIDYWERRLSEGTTFLVPDRRVLDAERNLLIQNLALTWRYSIGNDYEGFSFPESVDAAEVMGEYGFREVERVILRTALRKGFSIYPNLEIGEKLLGAGLYFQRFADRPFVEEATPVLRRYLAYLGPQLRRSDRRILHRERYASDLPDSVYGLNAQAVVWQGLVLMGDAWARTGHPALGRTARGLAATLEAGLRAALRASERRLPDGTLFVPAKLLDGEPPYDTVTASKAGSYWNLVIPYALASGLLQPRSPEAVGALRYLQAHGSRLLGLVRAGAYALYRNPTYPTSGTDEVYGLNAARFLADNDQADQLVLSLYGQLGAAMTPGTFVSGEAASVAPIRGEYYRRMYLPPNVASNAAFLEKLRLMLVHETRRPRGLELAFATPRAWLLPGRRIVVHEAPTSFGPLSYSIEAARGSIHVALSVPGRDPVRRLRLRLRLPRGNRIAAVALGGRPFRRFDAATETIDLSRRTGALDLVIRYRRH